MNYGIITPVGEPHPRDEKMKILAVEDGGFSSKAGQVKRGRAYLVGVIVDDFKILEVILSQIVVDGLDATERLIEMVKDRAKRIDVIMLASVSYGGLNLMDIMKLYNRLKVPVIIANPKKASRNSIEAAVKKHFSDWKKRLDVIQKAGKVYSVKVNSGGTIYFYIRGIRVKAVHKLLRSLTVFGNRPEPLRIARLISHGLGKVVGG
jgi:endonuclease V-like protein UPF0215 family